MGRLLTEPVSDHGLRDGYAANLEKYVDDLASGAQTPV
jgi:hypothetical protein